MRHELWEWEPVESMSWLSTLQASLQGCEGACHAAALCLLTGVSAFLRNSMDEQMLVEAVRRDNAFAILLIHTDNTAIGCARSDCGVWDVPFAAT